MCTLYFRSDSGGRAGRKAGHKFAIGAAMRARGHEVGKKRHLTWLMGPCRMHKQPLVLQYVPRELGRELAQLLGPSF